MYRPQILTRSIRFPPFGFATAEIRSNSIEKLVSYKCEVLHQIRAYLRCGEPEGRKPSALYQNPGPMHFEVFLTFDKKVVLLKYYVFN